MDCLGLLVILFVIFWAIRKSKNGNQMTKPNQPRQSLPKPNQPIRQSQSKPNQPLRQSRQTGQRQPLTDQTGNTYAKPAAREKQGEDILAKANRNVQMQQMEKQEELKARLKQKYGDIQTEQKEKKQPVKENAPVSVTDQTVQKAAMPPETVKEIKSGHSGQMPDKPESDIMELQEPQTSDLMREINDLMVKGYDGELTFSRDFVAEGIEMLNRIQM